MNKKLKTSVDLVNEIPSEYGKYEIYFVRFLFLLVFIFLVLYVFNK